MPERDNLGVFAPKDFHQNVGIDEYRHAGTRLSSRTSSRKVAMYVSESGRSVRSDHAPTAASMSDFRCSLSAMDDAAPAWSARAESTLSVSCSPAWSSNQTYNWARFMEITLHQSMFAPL